MRNARAQCHYHVCPVPPLALSASSQHRETRRVGGKVRHEHIASLGSIETPLSVADGVTFWQRVHERLAKLSIRIDPATQARHADGIKGVAAERTTGIDPGAAAGHVEGRGTSPASSASRRGPWCAESGLTKGACRWQVYCL